MSPSCNSNSDIGNIMYHKSVFSLNIWSLNWIFPLMYVFTPSQGILYFLGVEAHANTVLGIALWHLSCSVLEVSFSRTEMGSQPKGNLCFYTTQLLVFLWFPPPLRRCAGITASHPTVCHNRNWRTEVGGVCRLKSTIPMWIWGKPLHPSLGFLPVHYVGIHFFHLSSEEDPLSTSEILLFTCYSSCCCKFSEV